MTQIVIRVYNYTHNSLKGSLGSYRGGLESMVQFRGGLVSFIPGPPGVVRSATRSKKQTH